MTKEKQTSVCTLFHLMPFQITAMNIWHDAQDPSQFHRRLKTLSQNDWNVRGLNPKACHRERTKDWGRHKEQMSWVFFKKGGRGERSFFVLESLYSLPFGRVCRPLPLPFAPQKISRGSGAARAFFFFFLNITWNTVHWNNPTDEHCRIIFNHVTWSDQQRVLINTNTYNIENMINSTSTTRHPKWYLSLSLLKSSTLNLTTEDFK